MEGVEGSRVEAYMKEDKKSLMRMRMIVKQNNKLIKLTPV